MGAVTEDARYRAERAKLHDELRAMYTRLCDIAAEEWLRGHRGGSLGLYKHIEDAGTQLLLATRFIEEYKKS